MVREKEDGRGEKTKRSSLTNDNLSTESLFLPTNFNATGRQKDEAYSFFSDDLATTFLSPSLTSSNPSIVLDQDTNENGNDNPVNRRSGPVIQETTTTTSSRLRRPPFFLLSLTLFFRFSLVNSYPWS